jgi:hypothetical protein
MGKEKIWAKEPTVMVKMMQRKKRLRAFLRVGTSDAGGGDSIVMGS